MPDKDQSELFFDNFCKLYADLNKLYMEELGYDLWTSVNEVEYHNYLVDNPIMINNGGFGGAFGDIGSIAGFENISPNLVSLMLSSEGWYDDRAPKGYGDILKGDGSAVAGQSFMDRGGVITVGPGLTNYLNNNSWMTKKIAPGVLFTLQEIAYIYIKLLSDDVKYIKNKYPHIMGMPQNTIDACIDLGHSGWGWLKPLANARTQQEVASVCRNGPVTAKGKTLSGLVDRRIAGEAIALGNRTASTPGAQNRVNAYYNVSPRAQKLIGAIQALK